MSLWRSLSRLSIHLNNINTKKVYCEKITENWLSGANFRFFYPSKNGLHTSSVKEDLMEFFDDKENWTKLEVQVGRSWKIEELRIKSNSDLHKLWYVLLKEKNMLLTMEHEYNRQGRGIPSPERLDKVEESMENLEAVVRERNRAYFELETGETGERPVAIGTNCFGLEYKYKMTEHVLEKRFNKKFLNEEKLYNHTTDRTYVKDFLTRLEEKKRRISEYHKRRRYDMACKLMKIFPDLDEEALKAEFPDVDIEAVKEDPKSRAHKEL